MAADLIASKGDLAILEAFGQSKSVIYNASGKYLLFERVR